MNLRAEPVKLATVDKDAPSATKVSSVDCAELACLFGSFSDGGGCAINIEPWKTPQTGVLIESK